MIARALVAAALVVSLAGVARADGCVASRVDVADWPIVRSARVPGFTLRLPRSFVRTNDSTTGPSATWAEGTTRLRIAHRGGDAPAIAAADESPPATRCEERLGSATATIVSHSLGTTTTTHVVHATIRWPDGEVLDVRAETADHAQLDRLIAAVRTVRRVGA